MYVYNPQARALVCPANMKRITVPHTNPSTLDYANPSRANWVIESCSNWVCKVGRVACAMTLSDDTEYKYIYEYTAYTQYSDARYQIQPTSRKSLWVRHTSLYTPVCVRARIHTHQAPTFKQGVYTRARNRPSEYNRHIRSMFQLPSDAIHTHTQTHR